MVDPPVVEEPPVVVEPEPDVPESPLEPPTVEPDPEPPPTAKRTWAKAFLEFMSKFFKKRLG